MIHSTRETPIVSADHCAAHFGGQISLKLEMMNPTGTHKDRESVKIIEACKAIGLSEVGCASTGNLAVSLAFHAMNAGIKCHVWVSGAHLEGTRLAALKAFSAILHDSDMELDELYVSSSAEMTASGIFNANPGHCQAKLSGNAVIGREILSQVANVDTVICPVNNGSHLLGVAEGLKGSGIRLIGAFTHSPLARSIQGLHQAEGKDLIVETLASTGGGLVEATEEDLRLGIKLLMADGVIPEVSSAAIVGVLGKIDRKPDDAVCCVITGSGMKYPAELNALLNSAALTESN